MPKPFIWLRFSWHRGFAPRNAHLVIHSWILGNPEAIHMREVAYRNNYLIALKALSQNGISGALARTLDFAQRYTAAVDFAELDRARFILDRTHAFVDPNEGDTAGIRLMLPTADSFMDATQT